MERAEKFSHKLAELQRAVAGFAALLATDLLPYDKLIADGLRNGQIQKFEYCAELLWKVMAAYLREREAVETTGPKSSAKAFFAAGRISEAQYALVNELLEARNLVSHLYRQSLFDQVYNRLPTYAKVLNEILNAFN